MSKIIDEIVPAKLLELRRAARQEKKQRDDEHCDCHRQLLQLLAGPHGEWIREKAHEQIDKWESRKLCIPRYVEQWRLILAMSATERAAAVLRDDDIGVALRQNSPFDHSFHLVRPYIRKPANGMAKSTQELLCGAENRAEPQRFGGR